MTILDDLVLAQIDTSQRLAALETQDAPARDLIINVLSYGALGDGTTDDTTAIQSAAAAAAGGILLFPPGQTYILAGVTISAATIVWAYGATLKLKALATTVGSPILEATGANITFLGGTYDGNKAAQPADGFHDSFDNGTNGKGRAYRCAIKGDNVTNPTVTNLAVRDCHFQNTYGAGVATTDVDRVIIQHCTADDLNFELAFIDHDPETAVTALVEAVVTDCLTSDCVSGDGSINANAILIKGYRRVQVANNVLYNQERNGIKVDGGSTTGAGIVVVEGNVIDTVTLEDFGGIQIQGAPNQVIISHNDLYNCRAGITINHEAAIQSLVIADNLIDTTVLPGIADGILIAGTAPNDITDCQISGNELYNIGRYGIDVRPGGSRLRITDNLVHVQALSTTVPIFILLGSDLSELEIHNNLCVNPYVGVPANAAIRLNRSSTETYNNVWVTDNRVILDDPAAVAFQEVSPGILGQGLVAHNWFEGQVQGYTAAVILRDNHIAGTLTWPYAAAKLPKHLTATATWDPGNMADNAVAATTITVTGAAVLGSVALASHDQIGSNLVLVSAHVSAANTVRVVLLNKTGSALDIASGTLRVDVWQH